ncbi:MAG: adenylate kinase [Deltaproteobacteria bacterium]|nr:adenylate kinase [Deltaproteobacteria bacterium]
MNVILLGAPGAGKGTQAQLLVKDFHLQHISTGDLFRFEVSQETELGQQAKRYMDQGELVPDQIVVDMIQGHLPEERGTLLYGFPRTIEQAKALQKVLTAKHKQIDFVLSVDVPKEELVKRLLSRGRSDDNLETIENRLDVYQNQTKPLIEFYQEQGVLTSVDGCQEIAAVSEDIKAVLGASL